MAYLCRHYVVNMMMSSNGNIFRVTGPLCGEFTGPGEFPAQRPVTRSFDVFFDLRPNKRLSKQPWGWWFETPSWSLWRQCNDFCLCPTSVTFIRSLDIRMHYVAIFCLCHTSTASTVHHMFHTYRDIFIIFCLCHTFLIFRTLNSSTGDANFPQRTTFPFQRIMDCQS